MALTAQHEQYWKRNLRLISILMALWCITTFVMSYFARELSSLQLFGWPLSFYMAAQGALLIYLGLIGFYAVRMRQLDRQFGVQQDELKEEMQKDERHE